MWKFKGRNTFYSIFDANSLYSVDIDEELLKAGKLELVKNNLLDKNPVLVRMGDFNFSSLNREFDFALAQSVFTHLPLNSIIRCILNIEKVLVRGGRFYATFFESPKKFHLEPLRHPKVDGPDTITNFDMDPYHYSFEIFKWICEGTNFRVEYIGDWGHPRNQKMMVFVKE